jgi:murein DD-endopeptidase MepM/ murein hydrolase activator NlpD
MNIIIVDSRRGRTYGFGMSPREVMTIWAPIAIGLLLCAVLLVRAGWSLHGAYASPAVEVIDVWGDDISSQRAQIARMRTQMQDQTAALNRRVAQLQAHVTRLDAAGARMTQLAELDAGEFNFDSVPAVGGPSSESDEGPPMDVQQIFSQLDALDRKITDRERQMRVLEDLLLVSRLQKDARPVGWPVVSGWISSGFGTRTDPFTGRRARHGGIDFAGRPGSEVLAVGSGIVTVSQNMHAYGNLVEINHGNGYVTRYGHNQKNLVEVGQRVRRGQVIAELGQTGRATGPHVHFEVWRNGVVVNPAEYISAAR